MAKKQQEPKAAEVVSPEEADRRRAQREAYDQRQREECAFNEQEFERRQADVNEAVRRTRPLAVVPCVSMGVDLKRSGFVGQGAIVVTLKPGLPAHGPYQNAYATGFHRDLPVVVPVDPEDVARLGEFRVGQRFALALIQLPREQPWPKYDAARAEDEAGLQEGDPRLVAAVGRALAAIDAVFSQGAPIGWPMRENEAWELVASVNNMCQGVLNPSRLRGHGADAATGLLMVAVTTVIAPRCVRLSREHLRRRVLVGARQRPEPVQFVADLLESSGHLLRCSDGSSLAGLVESAERLAAMAFLAVVHFGAPDEVVDR
jgi:hypothetical protein